MLRWYDAERRDLPWRRTKDPYHILVSEIMLQQTQVRTVIPYYQKFIGRFPDFRSLARADIDEVLALWKGLGYYRRARNLHAAAAAVVERHGGELPDRWEDVRALPGVGEYTAAAVLSIAYGVPRPVVDGNVVRVAARLSAFDEPIKSERLKRQIAERLADVIPALRAGDFNQAMMELGATVCRPGAPACDRCPLAPRCSGHALGIAAELPVAIKRAKSPVHPYAAVVATSAGAVLLCRRPEEGLLGGLWGFPMVRLPGGEKVGLCSDQELQDVAAVALGAIVGSSPRIQRIRNAGAVRHVFTHLEWHVQVIHAELAAQSALSVSEAGSEDSGARWAPAAEIDDVALPKAMQKVWVAARQSVPG